MSFGTSLKARLGDRLPVKVHFLDNSSKMFLVEADVSAGQLIQLVLEKFSIQSIDTVFNYFGLFESKTGNSIDRCLSMDERVTPAVERALAENINSKIVFMIRLYEPSLFGYARTGIAATPMEKFYSLYEPLLASSPSGNIAAISSYFDTADIESAGLLRLQYIQARFNIITSAILTSEVDALQLGSIHFLIKFINFFATNSSGTSKEGTSVCFLENRIVEFIPMKHLKKSSSSFTDWETRLIEGARKLAFELGLTADSNASEGDDEIDRVTQLLDRKGVDIYSTLYRKYMTIVYKLSSAGYGIKYFKVTPQQRIIKSTASLSSPSTSANDVNDKADIDASSSKSPVSSPISALNSLLLANNACVYLGVHFSGVSLCDKDRNILATLSFSTGEDKQRSRLSRWGYKRDVSVSLQTIVSNSNSNSSPSLTNTTSDVPRESNRDSVSESQPRRRMTLTSIDGSASAPITVPSSSTVILEFSTKSEQEVEISELITDYSLAMVKELELEIMASHQATQRPVSVKLVEKGIVSSEIDRQSDGFDSVISSEDNLNRAKSAICDDVDINNKVISGSIQEISTDHVDNNISSANNISSTGNSNNISNDINDTDKHNSSNYSNNIISSNDSNIHNKSSSNIQISDKLPEWAEDCEFTLDEIQFAAATKIQSRYRGSKGREKVGVLIQQLIEEGVLEVEYSE